jgi:hypothetical protein
MDNHVFDALLRSLVKSRRSFLGGALALTTGWFGATATAARKKRHRKHRKPTAKPNAFGCLEVGDGCTSANQCCSRICDGKKGKKQCRAHGEGTCRQEDPGYCESGAPTFCDNSSSCICLRTTAGSNYCASAGPPIRCANCHTDADCEALGLPPGAACAPFSAGLCAFACDGGETGTICLVPCGADLPAED